VRGSRGPAGRSARGCRLSTHEPHLRNINAPGIPDNRSKRWGNRTRTMTAALGVGSIRPWSPRRSAITTCAIVGHPRAVCRYPSIRGASEFGRCWGLWLRRGSYYPEVLVIPAWCCRVGSVWTSAPAGADRDGGLADRMVPVGRRMLYFVEIDGKCLVLPRARGLPYRQGMPMTVALNGPLSSECPPAE
jgi:hypothetical protein